MANTGGGNGSPPGMPADWGSTSRHEGESIFESIPTRQLEAFGRKVTATAGHLISGDSSVSHHYQNALGELHKELRRPMVQQSVWSLTRSSPTDFVRSKLSVPEIQQRALSYLPDELLANVPEGSSAYSLFQGFQASVPEIERPGKRKHGRRHSRGRQLITERGDAEAPDSTIGHLRNEQQELSRRLERMGVRKYMCSSEISEIDQKIANLNNMRRLVMQRLAGLEQEEADIEHELHDVDNKLEDMEEELDGAAAQAPDTPTTTGEPASEGASPKFMSESIYEKLSSPRARRLKPTRRKSMAILHEHMERGSVIRELQAHNDVVTAIDFDAPFGTGVSAALDDTVRVWDLNGGRCIGLLEGHLSSVRCLQMEDNIVATGSMDATIRLWDLSRAQYDSRDSGSQDISTAAEEEDGLAFEDPADGGMKPPSSPSATSMQDCYLFSLEAHVAEVTALHLRGDTLVSGSADKTLRQWDLEKGRCIQTLDVLWAAAQAAATLNSSDVQWRQTGRPPNTSADFVGALQCFDAALACGTADGLIRLWDLRSGQVHRSLIGHTGPVTCLQFDDVHLVTGSLDRSIRIWDLRTGSIYDAFAFENPITSMMFDVRRIVAAAGEDVVKVYDKTDGAQWDCGPGASTDEATGGPASIIEKVRIKDGYLMEGRRDGMMGVWSC